uniref:Uncharacterized protein n=1 Tax=Mycena chlorophos TaxID=658473 RepID=A0ABQ0LAR2_MYCCL|nr:predicted protein [Mycena chlorophos]
MRSSYPPLAIRKTIASAANGAERAWVALSPSYARPKPSGLVGVTLPWPSSAASTTDNRHPLVGHPSVAVLVVVADMPRNTASLSALCWQARRRLPADDDDQPQPTRLGAAPVSLPEALEHIRRQYPPSPSSSSTSTLSSGRWRCPEAHLHPWCRPRPTVVCISSSRKHRRRRVITHPPPHPDAVALAHRRTHAPSLTWSTCAEVVLQDVSLLISVVDVVRLYPTTSFGSIQRVTSSLALTSPMPRVPVPVPSTKGPNRRCPGPLYVDDETHLPPNVATPAVFPRRVGLLRHAGLVVERDGSAALGRGNPASPSHQPRPPSPPSICTSASLSDRDGRLHRPPPTAWLDERLMVLLFFVEAGRIHQAAPRTDQQRHFTLSSYHRPNFPVGDAVLPALRRCAPFAGRCSPSTCAAPTIPDDCRFRLRLRLA